MIRRRGFSLIELLAVVCVVALLAAVVLDRLLQYQEMAEKAAMEQTVAAMRSALALRAAAYVVSGNIRQVAALEKENPFEWLSQRPANYAGAFFSPEDASVPAGSWMYDLDRKELVYRPRLTRTLEPGPGGRQDIRFVVVARLGALQLPAGQSRAEVSDLTVRPVHSYVWTPFSAAPPPRETRGGREFANNVRKFRYPSGNTAFS